MNTKRLFTVLITIALAVGLDRITKIWATDTLKGTGVRSYLNDFFRLVYAENTGAFLSLGSGMPDQLRYWLLTILPIVVLLFVLYQTLFTKSMSAWQVIAFSLILGGGGSNVFDRFAYGMVVDFMNMGFPNLRTGIFNVADMAIMAGLFMMIPSLFKRK